MKIWKLTIAAAILGLTGIAHAHTHLESAMPADNSVIAAAPTQIMLHFSQPTRLTSLSIQKEGEKDETMVSVLPKEAATALSVPVKMDGPGKYKVNWRAVGGDNHVMSGALRFTITAK